MIFGSVCSGIEAVSVAWHSLGWRAAWLAEIEAFPSAVLAHHYPDVPNVGDMMQIAELVRAGWATAPDVFVGGTPCQAFSVAGLRGSLTDARGALTLEYIRILDEIDRKRESEGKPAAVAVWENVPGVLTTADNAFGCFLAGLAGESAPLECAGGKWPRAGLVVGSARTVAWRVLDAQYFGVAQRRRRVFVVASARDDIDPGQILFEFDGVRRDIAPSRSAGEVDPGSAGAGVTFSTMSDPVQTLCARDFKGVGSQFFEEGKVIATFDRQSSGRYGDAPTASTIRARDHKSPSDLVAFGIPGNWIGRAPENGGNATEPMYNAAPCQTATDRHGGAHGVQVRRLTPTECERLQGFPDGYTLIPMRGKPSTDGQRFKALGNSMAVPVMAWIGARIAGVRNANS